MKAVHLSGDPAAVLGHAPLKKCLSMFAEIARRWTTAEFLRTVLASALLAELFDVFTSMHGDEQFSA